MTLKYNGIEISNVKYNGIQLETLKVNGNTVWTRTEAPGVIPSGTVIFSSSTAGSSQITIEQQGTYNITVVGAGGGGAAWLDRWGSYPSGWRASVAAGGAGGYCYEQVTLTAGVYTVFVGTAGNGFYSMVNSDTSRRPSSPSSVTGGAGGASYISGAAGTWTCSGGEGGNCGYGFANPGAGGSGITSSGGDGGSAYRTSGISRTTANGGNYIDVWATGGKNTSEDYGYGGGADSEYYASGPSWLVRGKGGGNGFVKIVKA